MTGVSCDAKHIGQDTGGGIYVVLALSIMNKSLTSARNEAFSCSYHVPIGQNVSHDIFFSGTKKLVHHRSVSQLYSARGQK